MPHDSIELHRIQLISVQYVSAKHLSDFTPGFKHDICMGLLTPVLSPCSQSKLCSLIDCISLYRLQQLDRLWMRAMIHDWNLSKKAEKVIKSMVWLSGLISQLTVCVKSYNAKEASNFLCNWLYNYWLRSRGDYTFGSVRLSICPSVCLWLGIQNGCCFDRLHHRGRSRF